MEGRLESLVARRLQGAYLTADHVPSTEKTSAFRSKAGAPRQPPLPEPQAGSAPTHGTKTLPLPAHSRQDPAPGPRLRVFLAPKFLEEGMVPSGTGLPGSHWSPTFA